MANVHSILGLLLAALSLLAFGPAEAKFPKKCSTKVCSKWWKCCDYYNCVPVKKYWWGKKWWYNKCVPCGNEGEHPCEDGGCKDGLVIGKDGKCAPCGAQGEKCCPGDKGDQCDTDHLICKAVGKHDECVACGHVGEYCCAHDKCKDEYSICKGDKCEPCGGKGEHSCNGKCKDHLVEDEDGKCSCGKKWQPCCDGVDCGKWLRCHLKKCVPKKPKCGGYGQRCCRRWPKCGRGLKCDRRKWRCVRRHWG